MSPRDKGTKKHGKHHPSRKARRGWWEKWRRLKKKIEHGEMQKVREKPDESKKH